MFKGRGFRSHFSLSIPLTMSLDSHVMMVHGVDAGCHHKESRLTLRLISMCLPLPAESLVLLVVFINVPHSVVSLRDVLLLKRSLVSPLSVLRSRINELESWGDGLLWSSLFRELWSRGVSLLFKHVASKCVFSGLSSINSESPVWGQTCLETPS